MGVGMVKVKMFDGAVRTLSLSRLVSCRILSARGSYGSITWLHGPNEGRKVWKNIPSDKKAQTSKAIGKRCAHGCRYLKWVSFAGIARDGRRKFPGFRRW